MDKVAVNSNVLNILRVYATALVFFCHSLIVGKECFGLKIEGLVRFIRTPAWGGVWMFLAIGGFLAAYGFSQHKYSLDKGGILKYYRGRIIKVLIPTWIFLSLVYIFNMQESHVRWTAILQWLTCTYNGSEAGIAGVGASWYVFIIMWLYFLAPAMMKVLYKFEVRFAGREFKRYSQLLAFLCSVGIIFRLGGVFLNFYVDKSIYYNWFYANVTGTIGLFLIGMIGERMLHYMPELDERLLRRYCQFAVFGLVLITCMFIGNFKYLSTLYKITGPCMFALSSVFLVMCFSYRTREEIPQDKGKLPTICNAVAPYTFMFYLWHSLLLSYIAEKISISSIYQHYFMMLLIGGIVTSFIAFLMTKMNDGVIKTMNLQKK